MKQNPHLPFPTPDIQTSLWAFVNMHHIRMYVFIEVHQQPLQYFPKLAKPKLLPSHVKPIAKFQSMMCFAKDWLHDNGVL